jgi:nucleoside-diphosphate-sugar epimerase
MATGKVLVTGASGYIAGFIIKALVADGWAVRGTIRNLARAGEVRATLGLPDLELVACDLMSDAGWAEAMDGIAFVQHIASPIPAVEPKDPDELIVPAREGALRALRFAHAAGVKRVVMTSSMAAIAYGHGERGTPFTEGDWSNQQPGIIRLYQVKDARRTRGAGVDGGQWAGDGVCVYQPRCRARPCAWRRFFDQLGSGEEVARRGVAWSAAAGFWCR